jgi:hypothetical protein
MMRTARNNKRLKSGVQPSKTGKLSSKPSSRDHCSPVQQGLLSFASAFLADALLAMPLNNSKRGAS